MRALNAHAGRTGTATTRIGEPRNQTNREGRYTRLPSQPRHKAPSDLSFVVARPQPPTSTLT